MAFSWGLDNFWKGLIDDAHNLFRQWLKCFAGIIQTILSGIHLIQALLNDIREILFLLQSQIQFMEAGSDLQHNIIDLLRKGLCVTINSDDPAYFGGQLNKNFEAVTEALDLDKETLIELARNSFKYSFLSEEEKEVHLAEIDAYIA